MMRAAVMETSFGCGLEGRSFGLGDGLDGRLDGGGDFINVALVVATFSHIVRAPGVSEQNLKCMLI